MTLLDFLVKKEVITKEIAKNISTEAKSAGKKPEEILLEKKLISEENLFQLKSENLKIPIKKIDEIEITSDNLKLIPEETISFYKIIPLAKIENQLEIGMIYPEDLKADEAINFLSRQNNFTPEIFLITISTFEEILKKYKTMSSEVTEALKELERELKIEAPKVELESGKVVADAPISRVVDTILKNAIEQKASDVHIEPMKEKMRIRFRLDGILKAVIFLPVKIAPAIVARIKIISNLKIDETRIPQDGRFSIKMDGISVDFRVAIFPTTLGEKVVLRILDSSQGSQNFEKLGLEGRNLSAVQNAVKKPYGLILVTGPTGSGKSTTLYAILNLLNKEGVNIVTLEDPAEYFIEGVNQSQVKPEIGYDFASGLRQILRQDPNVIMVGEIRDEETASLAVNAALTGHVVLSTLHTNNALGAIPRLVDLGVKPYLISPSLALAVAQRLLRKLCPECKKQVRADKETEEIILKELNNLPPMIKKDIKIEKPINIYQAVGCKACGNTGYKGRVAIFEILEMTKNLGEIILKDLSEKALQQEAINQGMSSMKQDGFLKVLKGATTIEEVLRVAEEK